MTASPFHGLRPQPQPMRRRAAWRSAALASLAFAAALLSSTAAAQSWSFDTRSGADGFIASARFPDSGPIVMRLTCAGRYDGGFGPLGSDALEDGSASPTRPGMLRLELSTALVSATASSVLLTIDDAAFEFADYAVTSGGAALAVETGRDSAFVDALMAGSWMSVSPAASRAREFALRGSARAIRTLKEACVGYEGVLEETTAQDAAASPLAGYDLDDDRAYGAQRFETDPADDDWNAAERYDPQRSADQSVGPAGETLDAPLEEELAEPTEAAAGVRSALEPRLADVERDFDAACARYGSGEAIFAPDFARRRDLNRDGVADYVVDAGFAACSDGAAPEGVGFCGDGGCEHRILLSQADGTMTDSLKVAVEAVEIDPSADLLTLLARGALCGEGGAQTRCSIKIRWAGDVWEEVGRN